jgi:putative membrane protein
MIPYLPAIDASLNAASAIFLVLGFFFVREKNIRAHKTCMFSAFGTSMIFLVCYLTYHYFHGTTHFLGRGAVRSFYFALLGSHTVLAALIVPLALTTLYRAWRERFEQHKRIARWTLPLWLYVSVTGVLVYWMLYHLYPSSQWRLPPGPFALTKAGFSGRLQVR